MMKNMFLAVSVATGFAMVSSGVVIENWQMNEGAGTNLSGLINSAGSAVWGGDVGNVQTDGSGNLRYTAGLNSSNNVFRNTPLTAPNITAGLYELSFSYSAVTIAGGDVTGANVGFGLRDSTGGGNDLFLVRLHRQNSTLRLQTRGADGNTTLENFGTNALSGALDVRAVFNLGTDLMDVYWSLGGGAEANMSGIAINDGQMDAFRMAANLNTEDFGATDFVDVDYLKLEMIPEPGTLGLMGVAGLGIFLARNKRRTRAETIIRQLERGY
jgi:hypothetical protein